MGLNSEQIGAALALAMAFGKGRRANQILRIMTELELAEDFRSARKKILAWRDPGELEWPEFTDNEKQAIAEYAYLATKGKRALRKLLKG